MLIGLLQDTAPVFQQTSFPAELSSVSVKHSHYPVNSIALQLAVILSRSPRRLNS